MLILLLALRLFILIQRVVLRVSDLLIMYSNLTEALPGKINETNYKYLLQKNEHFDIVKISMSAADNILYLRADMYRAGTNAALIKKDHSTGCKCY